MQAETYEMMIRGEILRTIAVEVMDVSKVEPAPSARTPGTLRLLGHLRVGAEEAYAYLSNHFRASGYTTLLRKEREGVEVVAIPGTLEIKPSRLWLAVLLFVITIISTMFVGGLTEEGGSITFNVGLGLAFSGALLAILVAHELGHFLVARRHGVAVSYPFFIPMPFSPIGTMGAFISMKEPPPDRRSLFAIAIAGPLAGLVVAIPVLLIGLALSEVISPEPPFWLEGNSLLYAGMKWLMFGKFLPGGGEDVSLHPVAFAGWVGLLVTGLNLIPAGQLDGGHILYALVGPHIATRVTVVIAIILLIMGLVLNWYGWIIWSALIMFLGQHRAPLLNEVVTLTRWQKALAVFALIIFVLVFSPVPFTQVTAQ